MNLYDLLEDYFVDNEDAVRTLITWFLSPVMEFEENCIEDNTKKASKGSSREDKGIYGGLCSYRK